MKGLFIPDITAEMFKDASVESVAELMTEGKIYDIDYQEPCDDAISRKEAVLLDKIIAEIGMYEADCRLSGYEYPSCKKCTDNVFGSIYRIINKYRVESEVKKG